MKMTIVLSYQLCLTLWDLMDCNLPGSSVHGSLQARILEWIAIPFSKRSFQPAAPSPYTHVCVCAQMLSHVNSSGPSGLMARQVALPMGVSRQEYCSGLPCPSPGDLSDPGIKPGSLAFPALAGRFFTTSAP